MFVDKVYDYITEYDLLKCDDGVIAGVSGGADSIAMLTVLNELSEKLSLRIAVCHINHCLRGDAADEDELYVKEYSEKLGIPFYAFREDIRRLAETEGLTEEEAGRKFRYERFRLLKEELGYDYIAVAHNRDDMAETILFHMLRGSSIRDLAGIRPKRDDIIRPLLGMTRSDIEAFLNERHISFRTDVTNFENDYSRNRIRNVIFPEMKKINAASSEHLALLAEDMWPLIDETDKIVDGYFEMLTGLDASHPSGKDAGIYIDAEGIKSIGSLYRKELLMKVISEVAGRRKDISRKHVDAAEALLYGESGKRVSLPYDIVAERVYDRILIKKEVKDSGDISETEVEKILKISHVSVSGDGSYEYSSDGTFELIDAGKVKGELHLRYPEDNDSIVIDSSGGRKKLSKLFRDMKIPRNERTRTLVVADDNDIIWVVGKRAGYQYRITEKTNDILKLEIVKPAEM